MICGPYCIFFPWWNDVERPVNNFHHSTFSDIVIICCYLGGCLEISYMCSLYCINVQNSHTKMELENVSPLPLLFVCDMLKRKHDFQSVAFSLSLWRLRNVFYTFTLTNAHSMIMQTGFTQTYELWLLYCSPPKCTIEEDSKGRALYKAVQLPLLD